MNKIIWIASYPKSGNTWIRYLLCNYFFNNKKLFDYNIIKFIKKFPTKEFLKFVNIQDEEIIKNPKRVSKFWIEAQRRMTIEKINKKENSDANVIFLKTHNALATIDNHPFTDTQNSLAIIHLVRDPRDIVISYSKFLEQNYDKTIDHMIKDKFSARFDNDPLDMEITGSWKFNFISWKDGIPDIPRIMIKYEDLILNPYKSFYDIISFLSQILKFEIDEEKIIFSIKNSSFDLLKKTEKAKGFFEYSNKNDLFFRKGKNQQWQDVLSLNQLKRIENSLSDELKFLEYL